MGTDDQGVTPTEVERRIRAAAEVEQVPRVPGDWWPRIGDLMVVFGASRSMVHRWLAEGVVMAGGRMLIDYTVAPGGIREARPSHVVAVLDAWRVVRNADNPQGVNVDDPASK